MIGKLLQLLGAIPGFGVVQRVVQVLSWPIVAIWRWSTADWRQFAITVLLLVAAHDKWRVEPALRADLDKAWQRATDNQHALDACNGTVANLKAAAMQAKRAQQANLERAAAEQAAINERSVHDFQVRIADLRARVERLQGNAAAAASGLSGATAMPGSGPISGAAAQAAGDHRFPAAGPACKPMTLHERAVATEQAIQLDELVSAVIAHSAVRTSP